MGSRRGIEGEVPREILYAYIRTRSIGSNYGYDLSMPWMVTVDQFRLQL